MIIRRAREKERESIDALMKKVYQKVTDKDWFVPDDRDSIARHMEKEGRIFLAVDNNTREESLAGFLILRYPKDAEDNLGSYRNLSPEEKTRVAHMESIAVSEEYRGIGLQKRLMEAGEACAKEEGFRYLMCTIAPKNTYSLNNAEKLGYRILATDFKYGGKLRCILCKEI